MSTESDGLEAVVERLLDKKFAHILEDITFRIGQAYDLVGRLQPDGASPRGRIYAEDLNIPGRAFITGYAVTNNSPDAGSIAWTDVNIVYSGQAYTITNGNTNLKYAWWSPTTTPTVLQTSNTKPVLAQGEVLVFMNNGGIAKVMLSDTNTSLPGVVAEGAVDSGAILANAVGSAQLADNAVGSSQLASNAVTSGKIADGSISRSGQLAANVVSSGKIADGAVTRAGQLAANVVTSTQIANNAVVEAAIGANAVTSGKLANGAVSRSAQLNNNVVTNAQIAANAVSTDNVQPGAVDATKLNVLRHFLI